MSLQQPVSNFYLSGYWALHWVNIPLFFLSIYSFFLSILFKLTFSYYSYGLVGRVENYFYHTTKPHHPHPHPCVYTHIRFYYTSQYFDNKFSIKQLILVKALGYIIWAILIIISLVVIKFYYAVIKFYLSINPKDIFSS